MKKLLYSFLAIACILTASVGTLSHFTSPSDQQGHPILPPVKEA